MTLEQTLKEHPTLLKFTKAQLEAWPDHDLFLAKTFKEYPKDLIETLEDIAILIDSLIEKELPLFTNNYKWMCDRFKEEQLYFHRNKKYRLNTIEEAKEKIYDNDEYMSKYIRGILLSQLFWPNHARAFYFYKTQFLPKNKENYSHLDIGAGHGLFLALTALDPKHGQLEAWDISATSLQETKNTLKTMNITEEINVLEQDVLDDSGIRDRYDSLICSEVLEHTEDPESGLRHILSILKPGGRAFINVPVNSPAPDHLFLWRSTDEVRSLFTEIGFVIEEFEEYPATGISLDRAKRLNLDISCVAILKKPS